MWSSTLVETARLPSAWRGGELPGGLHVRTASYGCATTSDSCAISEPVALGVRQGDDPIEVFAHIGESARFTNGAGEAFCYGRVAWAFVRAE